MVKQTNATRGSDKDYSASSVFRPQNLLREARRQKNVAEGNIPEICMLDPDGDILDYLLQTNRASIHPCWAGYHTRMYEFELEGRTVGIIGQAVGASFAVLLAEQMFVSGCELLISMTSAGTITEPPGKERIILIKEALRDEGTSDHYLPPGENVGLAPQLLEKLQPLTKNVELSIVGGTSWTTDAPYRETKKAIETAKKLDVNAVEMEASALYAFANAREKAVVCYAHLTNTMARHGNDFEKGEQNGSIVSLNVIAKTISALNDNNKIA